MHLCVCLFELAKLLYLCVSAGTLTQVMQRGGNRKEGVPSGDDCETGFSAEEVARFRVRLQEGYDLPDQRYSQWVRMYHPECEGVSELPRGGHEVTGAALSADTDPGENTVLFSVQ